MPEIENQTTNDEKRLAAQNSDKITRVAARPNALLKHIHTPHNFIYKSLNKLISLYQQC